MMKYYIEHASGNFTAPIDYAEKTEAEILDDILYYIQEGKESPFETLAEFESDEEAHKAFNKYYNDISVQKNGDRAEISYHIYKLEAEKEEES
jgi:hypothetical protein